eukprot:2761895-Amphidinium_carterae.2
MDAIGLRAQLLGELFQSLAPGTDACLESIKMAADELIGSDRHQWASPGRQRLHSTRPCRRDVSHRDGSVVPT